MKRGSMPPSVGRWVLCVPLVLAATAAWAANDQRGTEGATLQFNRDIRPILSETCYACHGPDKNKRKGKLRLDVRDAALENKAIVPGKPEESELVKRIYTADVDDVMPPPQFRKQLTSEQKAMFRNWIAAGAQYQPHWAYIKPVRSPLPPVKNRTWVRNPIDAFVLNPLERRGLAPAPESDLRTLLRRLSLDLVGLPPTIEETESFLKDRGAHAYERQVDRLLRSPHFGERMAAPWLDVVRFADTVGYHGDQNVNVFPYRDYVIDSFNRNQPFDQFTIEQIAGDLLPHPTTAQRVATGFNRLNMMTREGGAQPKEYLAKYAADRVRTLSTAWLGSTMACCECHDHKYDPFWTKDFYSMEAFFADIKQWGVYQDYGYTPNPDLKGWSNDHPFPPEIVVDSPYLRRRLAQFQKRIDGLEVADNPRADRSKRAAFQAWCDTSAAFLKQWPSGWATPKPVVTLANNGTNKPVKAEFEIDGDGRVLLTGARVDRTRLDFQPAPGWLSAIRLELLPHAKHDGHILRGDGESTYVTLTAALKPAGAEKEKRLAFYHADADHKDERYANGFALLGVAEGWKTWSGDRAHPQTAVWLLDPPLHLNAGERLIVTLGRSDAGCVRVSVSPFAAERPLNSGDGPRLRAALGKSPTLRSGAEHDLLRDTYFLSAAWDRNAFAQYKKLYRDLLECRDGKSPTLVTVAWQPPVTRVLPRGNWQNETGEIVAPAVPHFLPQVANPAARRLTRLDLAEWLVARDNPLTARTIVNRVWKQFFGAGISGTVEDLGSQGDWPTHPELLDWLAVEFMDRGWNLKHIIKLMVMSSTYRQSSNPRPEIKEVDPANRWLASQSPRRLEAEAVRDNALFIAGLLNLELGGPSTHPYQPAGYYANLQFPDRDYEADLDDREYRRGVYAHWQRTFLQPMLANFDAPSREECTASRNLSNTPQQALTLLNDPSFVEASRVFAARVLASKANSDDARLDYAYEQALDRPIRLNERQSLRRFLAQQRAHYQSDPDEAKKLMRVGIAPEPKRADEVELAAWTQVCRVVLNLQETITRY
ncbi:MAG: PSD1 and planctomycete cytochrome C domain-containing protein [Limisphaerales bacterium]